MIGNERHDLIAIIGRDLFLQLKLLIIIMISILVSAI